MKTTCPHCQADAFIRSSVPMTRTIREAKAVCSDIECGFTFIVQVAAVRSLSPSSKPHNDVNLPYSQKAFEALQRNAQISMVL